MKRDQDEIEQSPADLQDTIRRLAYERYEQRGRADGFDVDDWLVAEGEVLDSKNLANAA